MTGEECTNSTGVGGIQIANVGTTTTSEGGASTTDSSTAHGRSCCSRRAGLRSLGRCSRLWVDAGALEGRIGSNGRERKALEVASLLILPTAGKCEE